MLSPKIINYSVIIPHGKSLDTLSRAIDSVPQREDIEVIVVDNTPTPIAKTEVNSNRDYVLLFSAPNRHAGGARNDGVRQAIGKYLLFLDADDFFNEGAFDIFDRYLNSSFDIVYFDVVSKYSDTLDDCNRSEETNLLFKKYQQDGDVSIFRYRYYTPWCKLVRREFVVDKVIMFDEVEACNDLMFSMRSGMYASLVYADCSKPYCVTVRKGSLVHHVTKERSRTRYKVMIDQCIFMKSSGHPEYAIHMQSCVLKALKYYGWTEFIWYVKYAHQHDVSLLRGSGDFMMSVLRKIWKHDSSRSYKSRQ